MLGKLLRKSSNVAANKFALAVAWTGINPSVFTSLALLWAVAAAVALWREMPVLSIPLVAIAAGWDALDGAVARVQDKASLFGKYIEGIIDKWVEIIIYAGIFLAGYQLQAFVLLSTSFMLSMAKPRLSLVVPFDEHDWPGIGERVDRMTLLVVGLAVAALIPEFKIAGFTIQTMSLWLYVISAVVLVGHAQRVRYGTQLIEQHIRGRGPLLKHKHQVDSA